MTLSRRDLRKLQWPILGALLMILLAVLPAWTSHQQLLAAERERNAAAAGRQKIAQHLSRVRAEEQELKERIGVFQRLWQAGIVGPERRLEWTELLRDTQRQLRIPGLNYEIGPRKPLEDQGGDYAYFVSPMRLQLRLVHEEDLLRVLGHLQDKASALLLVRACALGPLAEGGGDRGDLAQLSADCDLRWITVDRPPKRP